MPSELQWWRAEPGGAEWLERLPRLAAECAAQWSLELEAPFAAASAALVVPAGEAVLKLSFPEVDSEHEGSALAAWGGEGGVRLLAEDRERRALLLERCRPGTMLWGIADEEEANTVAAGVLRRLWRPPPPDHPFLSLEQAAAGWYETPFPPAEEALVDRARGLARELAGSQGEAVVLHQDLHGGNVMLDERRGWLAIDPKPLVGEREFDTASLVRDRRPVLARDPRPGARIHRRLDQLSDELGLDRERMRGWGIVHAVAWGFQGGEWLPEQLACARWLADA